MTESVSDFAKLTPDQEIQFTFDTSQANVTQQLVSSMQIENISPLRNIVYKIKTTAPRNYVVKPNQGIIEAKGKA